MASLSSPMSWRPVASSMPPVLRRMFHGSVANSSQPTPGTSTSTSTSNSSYHPCWKRSSLGGALQHTGRGSVRTSSAAKRGRSRTAGNSGTPKIFKYRAALSETLGLAAADDAVGGRRPRRACGRPSLRQHRCRGALNSDGDAHARSHAGPYTQLHCVSRKNSPKVGAKDRLEVQVVDVELASRAAMHRSVSQRFVRPVRRQGGKMRHRNKEAPAIEMPHPKIARPARPMRGVLPGGSVEAGRGAV